MTQAELQDVGFRWTRPTWERTADRSWVLIVPSCYLDPIANSPQADASDGESCCRMYELFEFDGTWLDELHEAQVERMLGNPRWRQDFRQSLN